MTKALSPDNGNTSTGPARLLQAEPDWPQGRAFSLPQLDISAGRDAMLAYFDNTWALTETLFSALNCEEAYYRRPYHKTRHPLIFYYTHPVTFYINKLLVAGLISEPVNPHFEMLFETGVDEMSWDDLHEGEQDIWPALAEVQAYRRQVREMVRQIILTHPVCEQAIDMNSPGWALVMCFEHERIHLETSSVLIRELPLELLRKPLCWPDLPAGIRSNPRFVKPLAGAHYPQSNPLLSVPAQTVRPGKPADWPTFGWDNEYGKESRKVAGFKASKMLISNGEFYEFVSSGAYLNEKYWSPQGWAWRRFRNTRWPTFWVQDGPVGSHRYKLRTLFSVEPMPWDWPAIVNYYEARAYCAWRSERDGANPPYRLLQEKEHLALRDQALQSLWQQESGNSQLLQNDPVMLPLTQAPSINHQLRHGSEGPVDQFHANARGLHDVLGNVWQWCEDSFHPLQGFEIHPCYVDFSTPCFDGEHQMILGGSFISTGDEASAWARFHFRPHFFQHAGFRLVQGNPAAEREDGDKYETDAVLNQYMLFHWGSAEEQRDQEISASAGHPHTENFMLTMAALTRRFAENRSAVLDLGCAVGRASFELARDFTRVVGLDYSHAFIETAEKLRSEGSLGYRRLESGRHTTAMQARPDPDIDRQRISFIQGDAGALDHERLRQLLKPGSEGFDAILLSNLLCRLPDPAACLRQFTGKDSLLAEKGVLVFASPNTWLQQYTSPDNFIDAPDNQTTLHKLGQLLPGFALLYSQDLPFMIREHRRKYEYVVSQVSVWKRLDS